MENYNDIKQGEKGAWLSIAAYILLSALKLFIGTISGSQALLADGLNNSTDIIASIAVLTGLKISRRPPDSNHSYGHFRAETVAALIASFIMMAVGLQVLFQGVNKFIQPIHETPDLLAAWTAAGGALVMMAVYGYNIKLARAINSNAMRAVAQDNRSDALVSVGALIGIIGSQFGIPWLDPLTATLVGLMICKTAWDIFRKASHDLTDGFDAAELELMKVTVADIKGVQSIKDIKARIHGNNVLVDTTVLVDAQLNVVQSHDITEEIEEQLKERHQVSNVLVHIEPN
ncbi:cation diffusion facilitator family transporter [Paenibacillus monticola]|uniref:Cation diffusion facilitator family transporter n=1 Tax=Paenibacillus monticola TaxID=2666075 RepID=A0A7X2L2R0_9BACL|nr:cation diffusion facilitator family transporter [Paenibacillus monticola]MRN55132.1 cation diffusion facilitator family transporter [Paenibacillus monticola]